MNQPGSPLRWFAGLLRDGALRLTATLRAVWLRERSGVKMEGEVTREKG